MSNYVVLDLEMCKVPKGESRKAFQHGSELIQIGAVVLDESYRIKDTFMTYVAPQYGRIDSFIQRLTGITPKHTENAPSTEDALRAFVNWLPDDARLVAWSDSDRSQIEHEILGKSINIPKLDTYMADVDTDNDFTPDTEVVKDGYFAESEFRSAPYFDVQIDGITFLSK